MHRSHVEKLNDFTQNDVKITDKKWLNSAKLSCENKIKNW